MRIAVRALRDRIGWTQERLAAAVDKSLGRQRLTRHSTISKWELGIDGPSPIHRMALAKIAAKQGLTDLASIFRAPTARENERSDESPG